MDKKYQLVEMNKVFEFQLNTIYSLVRIKDILMKGLEEWNKKMLDSGHHFEELRVRDSDGSKFAIGNTWYRIDLFPNFSFYAMRVSAVQLDQVVDETLTTFTTNVFRIVNDATKDDSTKTRDFERFFFHSVELGYSLKVDDTIFEDSNIFKNPLCIEYPKMIQKEAHYETTLESDFIDNLKLNIVYKRDYDKYDDSVCTKISSLYKGSVLKKRFPVNEQIYLVEDVSKELLARAAMLKKEIEMKLNGK